jgi:AcrR family transcriptional regulator
MTEPVKRIYSSQLRATQARETRRAVVSAASDLFVSQGFGRTTANDIAAAAGVSRKTVFTSVGGKVELLKLAIDWALGGDDQPVAMLDRPDVLKARQETDPDKIVRGWAAIAARTGARVAGLAMAATVAAGIDDDAAALLDRFGNQRLIGSRHFVQHLAANGGLREDLTTDEAVDIVWLHNDPMTYHRLVIQRQWPTDRFEEWLYRTISLQLRDCRDWTE